ncbi:hypothetical protein NECAME_05355 [Necator americanus]|uniref:Uncharacterized protein n=1 Tax=Necator americanus TaxID=51031 RepID=W2SHU2_NECAM|nr:hypothetical protein NECAME_05355 [Necator americanus]ETN69138.1 hypothetical protein NECAME_05355 [Necator americanus]
MHKITENLVELEALMEYLHACLRAKKVPPWAIWVFAACFMLIVAVLLLDYCVIRRNALGNTCCSRARPKRGTGYFIHQKRTTNMLLNTAHIKNNQALTYLLLGFIAGSITAYLSGEDEVKPLLSTTQNTSTYTHEFFDTKNPKVSISQHVQLGLRARGWAFLPLDLNR